MASEKQIAANRVNAQKSTGPRTEGGKAVSRFNATTHGLTAKVIVMPGENPAAFEAFQQDIFAALKPEDEMQADVVAQIAGIQWRLRRIPHFAAALSAWRTWEPANTKGWEIDYDFDCKANIAVLQREFPQRSMMELVNLQRLGELLVSSGLSDMTSLLSCEEKLNRQLDRALKRLKELKATRAATIEHEPIEADPVECDAEDVTEEVTENGRADVEPETMEAPV